MSDMRLLIVSLGESEVPAFVEISRQLEAQGYSTLIVTWLPRLAGPEVVALANTNGSEKDESDESIDRVLELSGISHPSMAADFDRDWHFASVGRKLDHVRRVSRSIAQVMDDYLPTHLISSVGGETTRLVADAFASARGIRRLYFNALPIPDRFVLMPSLDSPFVPWDPDGRPRPTPRGRQAQESLAASGLGPRQQNSDARLIEQAKEGLARIAALGSGPQRLYPSGWILRKSVQTVRRRVMASHGGSTPNFGSGNVVNVLYPLHDERDFQVAVRERHAIPQENLLLYVSSVLRPGHHLWIKPHPEHAADHHPVLWRRLAARPNVSFLPANMGFKEAVEQSDVVFTLASSLGFEALRLKKPVVCYGSPFYSRRGLTIDVSDIRDIPEAISNALVSRTDKTLIEDLKEHMLEISWSGRFTPLDNSPQNLSLLTAGVVDALVGGGPHA
jgi:hypothetical protein